MGSRCARPKVQLEYTFLDPGLAPETSWRELKLEQDQLNSSLMEREEMERRVAEEMACQQTIKKDSGEQ